jgi:hypothetical protein
MSSYQADWFVDEEGKADFSDDEKDMDDENENITLAAGDEDMSVVEDDQTVAPSVNKGALAKEDRQFPDEVNYYFTFSHLNKCCVSLLIRLIHHPTVQLELDFLGIALYNLFDHPLGILKKIFLPITLEFTSLKILMELRNGLIRCSLS